MKKEEVLQTHHQTHEYLQQHKIRALFGELTRQLLLKRPQQPLSHLIDYLQNRNRRQIICLVGYDQEKRTRLSTTLANKYNFALINTNTLLGDDYAEAEDKLVSSRILKELQQVEKVYRGVVISGYPNNATQADALQKSGELPERYFMLANDEETIGEDYARSNSQEQVRKMLERNRLQQKQLKQVLGERVDELPKGLDKALQKVNNTVGLRFRKVAPLQAPRVLVIHPPHLTPPTLQLLTERYSLHPVTLNSAFRKMNQQQAFMDHVSNHIRQHQHLSKQSELALVEAECRSAVAKAKGLVLSGWPLRPDSLPFLKRLPISPHIILVFSCIKEKAHELFMQMDPKDPSFAITDKPSAEHFNAQLRQFEEVVEGVKAFPHCHILSFADSEAQVLKTFESLIQNPKIYS